MFLHNPFPDAFGLDIGDLSVKLVQLRHRPAWRGAGRYSLRQMRSISLSPGYIVNGEIQQPEMVRKKLLILLGKEGSHAPIAVPWAVVDLPEPKTLLKLIEINIAPDELTESDIIFHAKKHFPFELEEAYLDWHVVRAAQGRSVAVSEVLIGAAPKVIADSYTYLLESVGLEPLALEIEAVAIARALAATAPALPAGEQGAWAIVDIGATRSSVIIYDRESVQFTTSITFSGELVTTAIAQGLKMDLAAAEELKIAKGLSYDKKHPQYLNHITPLLARLVQDIKQAMFFYQEHFSSARPVTQLLLTGGSSRLANLDTTLSRELKVPTRPAALWGGIIPAPPLPEPERPMAGVVYTSAVGLALRAAVNPLRASRV